MVVYLVKASKWHCPPLKHGGRVWASERDSYRSHRTLW